MFLDIFGIYRSRSLHFCNKNRTFIYWRPHNLAIKLRESSDFPDRAACTGLLINPKVRICSSALRILIICTKSANGDVGETFLLCFFFVQKKTIWRSTWSDANNTNISLKFTLPGTFVVRSCRSEFTSRLYSGNQLVWYFYKECIF